MKIKKINIGLIEQLSTHLIVFTYKEGLEVGATEMKEALGVLTEYVELNGKIKLIIEVPPSVVMTLEAISYLQKNKYKNKNTTAVALVMVSIAQRVVSKYYHTKVEVGVPTKFFKIKSKAIEWISQI